MRVTEADLSDLQYTIKIRSGCVRYWAVKSTQPSEHAEQKSLPLIETNSTLFSLALKNIAFSLRMAASWRASLQVDTRVDYGMLKFENFESSCDTSNDIEMASPIKSILQLTVLSIFSIDNSSPSSSPPSSVRSHFLVLRVNRPSHSQLSLSLDSIQSFQPYHSV